MRRNVAPATQGVALQRIAVEMHLGRYGRMNAYSEDLRKKKKIVEAMERRGMCKSEVTRLFGVSLSSVKRYARMAREGWPLSPKKSLGKRLNFESCSISIADRL